MLSRRGREGMIDEVADLLVFLGQEPHREARALRLQFGPVQTEVRFLDQRLALAERTVRGHVLVETVLPGLELDERRAGALNRFAGLSAMLGGDPPRWCSRFTRYEGDDGAETLFPALVALAAVLQGDLLPRLGPVLAGPQAAGEGPAPLFEGVEMDPAAVEREMATAASLLGGGGLVASRRPGGLTAELPWPGEAPSAILGGTTTLLTVAADEDHPALGKGFHFRLDLPFDLGGDAPAVAAALNEHEAGAIDGPPLLGAWCDAGDGHLAFVCFLPAPLPHVGLVTNVVAWQVARHALASAWPPLARAARRQPGGGFLRGLLRRALAGLD